MGLETKLPPERELEPNSNSNPNTMAMTMTRGRSNARLAQYYCVFRIYPHSEFFIATPGGVVVVASAARTHEPDVAITTVAEFVTNLRNAHFTVCMGVYMTADHDTNAVVTVVS